MYTVLSMRLVRKHMGVHTRVLGRAETRPGGINCDSAVRIVIIFARLGRPTGHRAVSAQSLEARVSADVLSSSSKTPNPPKAVKLIQRLPFKQVGKCMLRAACWGMGDSW